MPQQVSLSEPPFPDAKTDDIPQYNDPRETNQCRVPGNEQFLQQAGFEWSRVRLAVGAKRKRP
jgi:hypothetical protein